MIKSLCVNPIDPALCEQVIDRVASHVLGAMAVRDRVLSN